jgi:hypothetical protein
VLQVIELKRGGKEKRARRVTARPEPTIFGNCEGWNFIVGKKGKSNSAENTKVESLRHSNMIFMHSLFTILWDNLCTACG